MGAEFLRMSRFHTGILASEMHFQLQTRASAAPAVGASIRCYIAKRTSAAPNGLS
jgi:hypothetical protein